MLQKLNERIQGLIAWIIISLVMITFALFGLDYYMQARNDKTVAIKVNGEPISSQSIALSERRANQLHQLSHDNTTENPKQLHNRILNELIQNQVLLQAAKHNGFYVNDNETKNAIASIPQFQDHGNFSPEKYNAALNAALFNAATFHTEIQTNMLLNQQRFAFTDTDFILDNEREAIVRFLLETRNYAYLRINADHFLTDSIITNAEIDKYYQQHKQEFLTPEQVSIDYIQLSLEQFKAEEYISEAEIKHYYDENQIKQPLDEIKQSIKSQLILERSEQKYNKALDKLSDLSYQTPDSLQPVADALHVTVQHSALFTRSGGKSNLTQNKRILHAAFSQEVLQFKNNSMPIMLTEHDVVVLRIKQHQPKSIQPLSAVQSIIQTKLRQQQASIKAKLWGETIAKQKDVFKNATLHWVMVNNAVRNNNTTLAAINNAAFQLTQKHNQSGLSLDNGDYIVVHLIDIQPGKEQADNATQRALIKQQLDSDINLNTYTLYIISLMQHAIIAS